MNKKAALLVVFFLCASFLRGDWMEDVNRYFKDKDYQAAETYLASIYPKSESSFQPTLCALLAYCAGRISDKPSEFHWIMEYFEVFWGRDVITHYLDKGEQDALEDFLNRWRIQYPLIWNISLVEPHNSEVKGAPSKLIFALDAEKEGAYKLLQGGNLIKAGLFQKGYNSFSIPAKMMWEKRSQQEFMLEFKVGELILQKKVELEIRINSQSQVLEKHEDRTDYTYDLSLYLGSRLMASSRKIHSKKAPIDWGTHPGVPYTPPLPPKESNTRPSSFSIFSAIGLAAGLVKQLAKKDVLAPTPPPRLVRMMTETFSRQGAAGEKEEMQVTIRLKVSAVELKLFRR